MGLAMTLRWDRCPKGLAARRGGEGRTDCHTSDIGHWFAMTEIRGFMHIEFVLAVVGVFAEIFQLGAEDVFRRGKPEDVLVRVVFRIFEGDKRLASAGRVNDTSFAGLFEHGAGRVVGLLVMRIQGYGHAFTPKRELRVKSSLTRINRKSI